jgi:hypothetical protein
LCGPRSVPVDELVKPDLDPISREASVLCACHNALKLRRVLAEVKVCWEGVKQKFCVAQICKII